MASWYVDEERNLEALRSRDWLEPLEPPPIEDERPDYGEDAEPPLTMSSR